MSSDAPIDDERTRAMHKLAEKLFAQAWSESIEDEDGDNETIALNALDAAEAFYDVLEWHQSPSEKTRRARAKRAAVKAARTAAKASRP